MAKSSLPRIDGDHPEKESLKPGSIMTLAEDERLEHAPISEGYVRRNVHVKMNSAQSKTLAKKMRALQDRGAMTANGKHVDNLAQTVRWMLENMVDTPNRD